MDEIAEDDDPRVQQVYRRLRVLTLIGGLTMGVGFLSVMSVIAYRLVKSSAPAGAVVEETLTLPAGARVLSTAADAGRIVLTVEAGGHVSLHVLDAATLKPAGRLTVAPGGASVPPLR